MPFWNMRQRIKLNIFQGDSFMELPYAEDKCREIHLWQKLDGRVGR